MKYRLVTLLIFGLLAIVVFVYPRWTASVASSSETLSAPDYSNFLHGSPKHIKQACSECHKAPTPNSAKTRGFPDVADYPNHDSCLDCHRQQFFNGARPVICTVCHTIVSPRSEARFAFRNPKRAHQFTTIFPHDKHQDVIATLQRRTGTMLAHAAKLDENKYNNCTICHETNSRVRTDPPEGLKDSYSPASNAFKTMPSNHESCFNCHWKSQEPIGTNCAGCHQLTAKAFFPREVPERISLRFNHTTEQHQAECTTCHIRITQASDIAASRPDVPINSCIECHKSSPTKDKLTIEYEIEKRKASATYSCRYCHVSNVGKLEIPPSHLAIFQE